MADFSGRILNERYLIETLIGQGGMGAVYRGRHVMIGKQVAVKFLHAQYTNDDKTVARFFREAQAAAAIGNKNIIQIFDVGVTDKNTPYMVMEYLEGESLDATLDRNGILDAPSILTIMEPVISALAAAHKKGVVHRDLKPENIFIIAETEDSPAAVKLIDFGISKFMNNSSDVRLTGAGTVVGTPAYMAPEQISNARGIDHRADLYSVGVILFEMLTGRLPYDEMNPHQLIAKILSEPLPPLLQIVPDLPREMLPILNRALSRIPSGRYNDAAEMLRDLRRVCTRNGHNTQLTDLTSGILEKKCATGDLGLPTVGSPTKNVRGGLLSNQPRPWTGATGSPPSETTFSTEHTPPGRLPLVLLGMLLSALAVGTGAFFAFRTPPPAPATPTASSPPSTAASTTHSPALTASAPAKPTATDSTPTPAESVPQPTASSEPDTDGLQALDTAGGPAEKTKSTPAARTGRGDDKKSRTEKIKFKQGKRGSQIVENFE